MHDHFTGHRVVNFSNALFEWSKFSRADLQQILISFAYDASELGLFVATRCFPVQGNASTNAYDIALSNAYDVVVAQSQLFDIRNALAKIDDEQLYGWQDAMEDMIRATVKEAVAGNKADVPYLTARVLNELRNTFYWNHYQLMVFPNRTDADTHLEIVGNPDYIRVVTAPDDADPRWFVAVHWSLNDGETSVTPATDPLQKQWCSDDTYSLNMGALLKNGVPGVNGVFFMRDRLQITRKCRYQCFARNCEPSPLLPGIEHRCYDKEEKDKQELIADVDGDDWPKYYKTCTKATGESDYVADLMTCSDSMANLCIKYEREFQKTTYIRYFVNTGQGY